MSDAGRPAGWIIKRRWPALVFALLALPVAWAATYTAPSGYLQVVGYKLQRSGPDGRPELAVAGWVEALADCSGATLLFDVLDRNGNQVGTIRILHGAFFRHDRWELGPGVFTPEGRAAAEAMNAADHVRVREADCS